MYDIIKIKEAEIDSDLDSEDALCVTVRAPGNQCFFFQKQL